MLHEYLQILNRLVVNLTLVVIFSLWAYLTIRSWGMPTARALTVMLFGVFVTAASDVLIRQARDMVILEWLSRATWVGILLVPASMLHMVLALARQLQVFRVRQWWIWVIYAVVALFAVSALFSNWLISLPFRTGNIPTLTPGTLFGTVAVLAFGQVTAAWVLLMVIRNMVLTPHLRRRMLYMLLSWYGPLLLSFPVLSLLPDSWLLPDAVNLFLATLVAPVAAIFTMVTAYSATFVGTPQSDFTLKHDFMRWWLYGPFVGVSIVLFMQVVPVFAHWSRLPEEVWAIFGVMTMTVLMPLLINRIRPYFDQLIYANDQDDISYLRALPRTAFTQADLRRFLENTLTVMCGALRVDSAFVAAPDELGSYGVKSLVGPRRLLRVLFEKTSLDRLIGELQSAESAPLLRDGYAYWLLLDPDQTVMGILGVAESEWLNDAEVQQLCETLTSQVEHALVMVHMQQRLIDTLRLMEPEFSSLQRVNSRIEQATPEGLHTLEKEVALMPDFVQVVRDALTHYWGGPKLTDSPLLGLNSVKRLLEQQGGNPTKALQAVLRQAIENLRPGADVPSHAPEWLLYNILEMRFLQGRKIRDTAIRLALSESDLYRKQRLALDEVARQLAHMEESLRQPLGEP
jgi:hypothetical protein